MKRGIVIALAFEPRHLDFDNTRTDPLPTRMGELTISNDSKRVGVAFGALF